MTADQVSGEPDAELVAAEDRSLVALLGASPGAPTAAFIAIGVLEKCLKHQLTSNRWLPKLKEIIPSYVVSLIDDAALQRRIRAETAAAPRLEKCLNDRRTNGPEGCRPICGRPRRSKCRAGLWHHRS